MAPLKVRGVAGSSCTQRVLTTIVEKNITDWELVRINFFDREHKQPKFLALQPFGVFPVLQDCDLTLFESRAIARYIAIKWEGEGSNLYGSTLKDKALVEQWLEVESQNFNPPISTIVGELFKPLTGGQTDQAVVDANIPKLEKVLDIYEAHLAKSKYLAGDFFSLADLSHIPYTNYLITVGKKGYLFESRPHVNAWWADISSRPSWKKVIEIGNSKSSSTSSAELQFNEALRTAQLQN